MFARLSIKSSLSGLVAAAVLGAFSWSARPLRANTVNVQFEGTGVFTGQQGSFSGSQGAYTGDGLAAPVWNVLSEPANATSGSLANLVTSANVPTGIGVSFTSSSTYGDPTSPANALLGGTLIASNSTPQVVTLTGLTGGGAYTLYLYGQNGGYNSDITTFAVTTGTGAAASGQFDQTIDGGSSSGTFYNTSTNNNYTIFNATANAAGTLGITYTGSTEGVFNGLQIIGAVPAVPEPASLALVGVGALCLLLTKRRRGIARVQIS